MGRQRRTASAAAVVKRVLAPVQELGTSYGHGMVQSTHDVLIGDREVTKTYRSWLRGEPDREWAALGLLHRLSPGLAPEPLARRVEHGGPVIVMSRVDGDPLGTAPLHPAQVAAVGEAMRRMYNAVPPSHLDGLADRRAGPAEMVTELRSWCHQPREAGSAVIEKALSAATAWVARPDLDTLTGPLADRVFSQGDGNLGNFIWDGARCTIVDFEDSGVSDPAYEVADLIEHLSVWLDDRLDVDQLLAHVSLTQAQLQRMLQFRRLMALFWLLMLLPGNRGHERNPAGTVERQAYRVQDLLA